MRQAIYPLTILLILSIVVLYSCLPHQGYTEKEISFTNPDDDVILSGTLSLPNSETDIPAVVLIQGSGAHERDMKIFSMKPFQDLSDYLVKRGIAVLRYDKRGCGKSGGTFVPYDMENFTGDAVAAVGFLKSQPGIDPGKIGLAGISQGGLVAPMAAVKCNDVNFIIMLAGPGIWGKEFFFASQLAITRAGGFSEEKIGEMKEVFDQSWYYISKPQMNGSEYPKGINLLRQMWSYIDYESRVDFGFTDENALVYFDIYRSPEVREFYDYDPAVTLRKVKCPVLALNGDKDVQVTAPENLPAIEKALTEGGNTHFKIIELKGHNHLFQKCKTGKISEYKKIGTSFSDEALEIIGDWILKATLTEGTSK
nr:alpha/beta fold hydrolase [Bacteroidota bacterium]